MSKGTLMRIGRDSPLKGELLRREHWFHRRTYESMSAGARTGQPVVLLDMNVARSARIFGDARRNYMTDLQVAEEIAWYFLRGFGVDRSKLNHRPVGKRTDEGGRYYEAPLSIRQLPHLFERTRDHLLVSYEVGDHRYPLALIYEDTNLFRSYGIREWRRLALMPQMISYTIPQQFERACEQYGRLCGRDVIRDDHRYISYAPCRASMIHDELPRFPGVFPPGTDYTEALLCHAAPRIENRCYAEKDVRVLVLGSGSGVEAVEIAKRTNIAVDCTDINPLAVANTRASALYAGVDHLVCARWSDGFDAVKGRYDFIVFNAPLPVWGKKKVHPDLHDFEGRLLRRVFDDLPNHLRNDGMLLLMSHYNIDDYLPKTLSAERIFPFSSAGVRLAIHEVRPVSSAVSRATFVKANGKQEK